MIIKKILNNNVVIAEGKSGKESVVMCDGPWSCFSKEDWR
ncbi:hypothetical protein G0Q64_002329 [Listeria monocytogenes]|nr:hypothetical protein [Listeria monocytogenes]